MKKVLLFLLLISNLITMKSQTQDPWTEYINPAAVHQTLAKYTGNFTLKITMPRGDGKEPAVSTVKSDHKMLLGGRFLEMKQKGIMMGMPFEAIMTLGFNNTDKKIAFTTITNMGTGTLALVGDWNEQGKSATVFGKLMNPVSKTMINIKQTIAFIDDNTILIESFDQEGDQPALKTVEYKLTRNK